MDPITHDQIVPCPLCGRVHVAVPLRLGERALCIDCGTRLPRRSSHGEAPLAFTLAALIFAIPAVQLPLVVVRKFGAEHHSHLWSGIRALWESGMPLLSVWVALCGLVVPLALLATLITSLAPPSTDSDSSSPSRFWTHSALALQHWSMPEVQVLAILVAFVKIGVLVDVRPGAGLWCYAGMTLSTLLAWRSMELREAGR